MSPMFGNRQHRRRDGGAGSLWPTAQEMGELVVDGPEPYRVLLGRLESQASAARVLGRVQPGIGRPPLAAPSCYGVLVVGPSRSGKTSSLLVPAVIGWDGPVVATSIRSDVLQSSWEAREAKGWPTLIYNPNNQGGYGSNTWSPLIAAMGERPWEGARRTATALVHAAGLAEGAKNSQMDFWNAASADYLGPLLLAAAQEGPSMEPVIRWLQRGDLAKDEIRERLGAHPAALMAAESVWAVSARQRDSIYLTARTSLSAYQDPAVMSTCQGTDITPDSVLGSPPDSYGATLYLVAPPTDWRYFAPLFSALLGSLLDAAYKRGDAIGGLDPPVLLALDEVANIAPIRELPSIVSTAAGAGIQLMTVLQDLGQADRIWGSEGRRTLLQNHYARLVLGGGADKDTLEWAQQMVGEVEFERMSRSMDAMHARSGSSISTERRAALTLAELRGMPRGTALLICGAAPAARVTLRPGTTI